ncbi:hypothetical protein IT575_00520 [bacterium]|nr:hypothetical protein [bacterium]
MNVVFTIVLIAVIAVSGIMTYITLSLNTKSDGIGAAITGASDSYRGAVGVEEQKRKLLGNLGYTFGVLCLLYTIFETYL